jgi:hypothetical protein
VHGQLTNEIAVPDGRPALVMSASKELESGARAMLLLAEGLFRLDVLVTEDTLRTMLRNLSSGAIEMHTSLGTVVGENISLGDAASYQPGRAELGFTIGKGEDAVWVKATIATLRFFERGTMRVSAQAIIRQAPAEETAER